MLADFSLDDLKGLMDVEQKHQYKGSYWEQIIPLNDTFEPQYTTLNRDFCSNHSLLRQYVSSTDCALSWATMIVNAAERALAIEGIEERLSIDFVMKCFPRNGFCRGMRMNYIESRFFSTGLISEEEAERVQESGGNLCQVPYSHRYFFQVVKLEGPNRGGLMNLIAEGNPVLVAISVDLTRLRYVKDMREDEEPMSSTVFHPSFYALVTGYKRSTKSAPGY